MARSPELAHLFQQPDSSAHRHYEICRADFYESAPADEIAKRFHLHSDSVRATVRDFARAPDVNSLFAVARPGPKTSPKRDAIHERARAASPRTAGGTARSLSPRGSAARSSMSMNGYSLATTRARCGN